MLKFNVWTRYDIQLGRKKNGKPIIHAANTPLRVAHATESCFTVKAAGRGNHREFDIHPAMLYVLGPDGKLVNLGEISLKTFIWLYGNR